MLRMMEMQTPAGKLVFPVFESSADVVCAFRNGEIAAGAQVFYNGMICEVIAESGDAVTGEPVPELLAVSVGPGTAFEIHMG